MMNDACLKALHVINTRPINQAASWTKILQQAGMKVTELPALKISAGNSNWQQTIKPLQHYDHLIFTSVNAVHYFFNRLPTQTALLTNICVSAIGAETAMALQKMGFKAHYPNDANSEALLAMPHLKQVGHANILLVKGVGGRLLLAHSLREKAAQVSTVDVYQRNCPTKPSPAQCNHLWQNGLETIILSTSKQAVGNLFNMLPAHRERLQQSTWLVLSQRIADHAQTLGVKQTLLSSGKQLVERLKCYQQQGQAYDGQKK